MATTHLNWINKYGQLMEPSQTYLTAIDASWANAGGPSERRYKLQAWVEFVAASIGTNGYHATTLPDDSDRSPGGVLKC